jgi:hypothetical protein
VGGDIWGGRAHRGGLARQNNAGAYVAASGGQSGGCQGPARHGPGDAELGRAAIGGVGVWPGMGRGRPSQTERWLAASGACSGARQREVAAHVVGRQRCAKEAGCGRRLCLDQDLFMERGAHVERGVRAVRYSRIFGSLSHF